MINDDIKIYICTKINIKKLSKTMFDLEKLADACTQEIKP